MKKLVIMIPGNPSVPGIYEPFIKQLIKDLELEANSHYAILSHLGQCNQKSIKRKNISVFDVIDDHKNSIDNLIKQHSPDETILIGHSLGSAITISLYQDISELIDQFVILCPFTGPSKNNIKYLKMFRNPITQLGMKKLSHSILINKSVSRRFFKKWLGENPFNDHIIQEIKKPHYINNFFSLVSNYIPEFEALRVHDKMKQMNPEHTFFLFVPNDYWVPDTTRDYLPKGSKSQLLHDISHDFCLNKNQYQKVSSAITEQLRQS